MTCPDCRLWQEDVHYLERVREILEVDLVDLLSSPGMDGILSNGESPSKEVIKGWFQKLVELHQPVAVAVVGHCNCGGNPVSDEQHEVDVRGSVETVKSWVFEISIIGILAEHQSDTEWPLKVIA